MVRYMLVSTKEIRELTAEDVNLVIAWLVAAPGYARRRNAPEKPIRIFLLNKRYSFNGLVNELILWHIQRDPLSLSCLRTKQYFCSTAAIVGK